MNAGIMILLSFCCKHYSCGFGINLKSIKSINRKLFRIASLLNRRIEFVILRAICVTYKG